MGSYRAPNYSIFEHVTTYSSVDDYSVARSRFALMESKVALVQLLSRFNLRVVSKTPIPIEIIKKGFNMTVDGGFWLGLEQRVKA